MKQTRALALATVAAISVVPAAFGHAGVSPPVVLEGHGQLFALTVPTEEENLTTTSVELTLPSNFRVFSFAAAPGWKRTTRTQGKGQDARITSVRWTGGQVPLGEAAVFEFVGLPDGSGDYRLPVRQTYSDGSVISWSGPADSDEPAPVVEAKSSLGGGTSTLSLVALIVGAAALLVGIGGLVAGRGRPLA